MTTFLDILEFAAARGDGLHPKLLECCGGAASAPQDTTVTPIDHMVQSGPHRRRAQHAQNAVSLQQGPLSTSKGEK
jgi:hypothetical protein